MWTAARRFGAYQYIAVDTLLVDDLSARFDFHIIDLSSKPER